jgi:hypothetical protein
MDLNSNNNTYKSKLPTTIVKILTYTAYKGVLEPPEPAPSMLKI